MIYKNRIRKQWSVERISIRSAKSHPYTLRNLQSTAGLASMRLEITEISCDTPQSKASRGLHGLAE